MVDGRQTASHRLEELRPWYATAPVRAICWILLLTLPANAAGVAQQTSVNAQTRAAEVENLKQQAVSAAALNNYAEAARLLARALVRDPADGMLARSVEMITSKEGAAGAAEPILKNALVDRPAEDAIRLALAQCYQHLEQDENAIATLSAGTAKALSSPVWQFTKGFSLFRMGQYSQAEEIFHEILGTDQIGPAASFFIGNCRFGQGDLAGALPWYQSAVQSGESSQAAGLNAYYYNYGLALFRLERYQEASNAFFRATTLNSSDPLAPYFLGRSQAQSGEIEDALAILKKVADTHPDFGPAFLQLGMLYRRTGNQEQAKSAFARVGQIKAAELEEQRLLGQMRLDGDQPKPRRP